MCGIAGILDLGGQRTPDREPLLRMARLLAHRGPDGEGLWQEPGIGLAHRRLSIIDLAGGDQPMHSQDGSLVTVFNGEIYNYRELFDELRARGHVFRTECDTEVLLNGWHEWGHRLLDHLNGMFAFALYDRRRRLALLARDRLGEKPLYFTTLTDGRLHFASELRALVSVLPRSPDPNPKAIEDYFAFGYVPDPRTIYRHIYKLPPAQAISIALDGSITPERITPYTYWHVLPEVDPAAPDDPAAMDRLGGQLVERLQAATRLRMSADVPLGAFLSGGVDSGAVVSAMASASDSPVRTCTIAFKDQDADESRFAATVAHRYGTDHAVEYGEVDAEALIGPVAAAYGEPFADSSALPSYRVSALARKRVTVALSGDGGDEVFAGYRRHAFHLKEEQLKARLPGFLRRALFGPLAAMYPKLDWAPRYLRAKATFEALAGDAVSGYFRAVTLVPPAQRRGLFTPDFEAELDGYRAIEVLRRHADAYERAATRPDPLGRIQYIDLKTWLPGGMLTKIDRASMANGLEVRAPFLDHGFVEWAAGLPARARIDGMEGKALLKKTMEAYLPREVLYRPKQGFGMPLAGWLRGAMADRVYALLKPGPLQDTGILDPKTLRRLVDEHMAGRRDHARVLWAVVMFDAFLRRPWAEERERPLDALAASAQGLA